jgi:hypothetical protein
MQNFSLWKVNQGRMWVAALNNFNSLMLWGLMQPVPELT